MNEALARAEIVLRAACGPRLRTQVSMAPLTTFRIGGPAALYLEPESDADLAAVSAALAQADIPVVILGKGSNVLVSDQGFPGLVLRLGRGYRWAARDGDEMTAGGAMPLPALAGIALRHHLTGLEFGVAIPATLGGAVTMNAGAHARAMADVVRSVEVFRLASGRAESVPAAEAGFTYRRSSLGDRTVVIGARLGARPRGAGDHPGAHGRGARVAPRHAAARRAQLRQRLQESPGRPRRTARRGGGAQGDPPGQRAGLDEARELHRGRPRRAGRRCAPVDRADPTRRSRIERGSVSSPRSS